MNLDARTVAGLGRLDTLDVIDTSTFEPLTFFRSSSAVDPLDPDPRRSDHVAVWSDSSPLDERALRQRTEVRVGEDTVGLVDGVVTAPDRRITALRVVGGHLWHRHTVDVPIDAVITIKPWAVTASSNRTPARSS